MSSKGRLLVPQLNISRNRKREATTFWITLPDAEFVDDREQFDQEMAEAFRVLHAKFMDVWDEMHREPARQKAEQP